MSNPQVYIPQEREGVSAFAGFDQWQGDDGEASHDSSQEDEGMSKGAERVLLPAVTTSGDGDRVK